MLNKSQRAKEHLAAAIRSIMRERMWNQADFARAAGVGQDVVSTYLTMRSMASLNNLRKIAKNIGEPVDRFLLPDGGAFAEAATTPARIEPSRDIAGVRFAMDADRPGYATIEIAASVPVEIGLKIMALVNEATNPKA